MTYASRMGSTAEIGEAIAERLRAAGLDVTVVPVGQAPEPEGFDAVVCGSAIYATRWDKAARHYIRQHRQALAERPTWLFESGPCGDSAGQRQTSRSVLRLAEDIGLRSHAGSWCLAVVVLLCVVRIVGRVIALALPHAGIAPLIAIAFPVIAMALTVAFTVPRGQRRVVWAGVGFNPRRGRGLLIAVLGPAAIQHDDSGHDHQHFELWPWSRAADHATA